MYTIYEQQNGSGQGLGLYDFIKIFDNICEEHRRQGRAKAFAFLFYDFNNQSIRRVLKNAGGFKELNNLAGSELSIFYFHSNDPNSLSEFNDIVIKAFEFEREILFPAMIFFRVNDREVDDIKIVELIERDYLSSFRELYKTIEDYIKFDIAETQVAGETKINRVTKSVLKIAQEQFVRVLFELWYKKVFEQH